VTRKHPEAIRQAIHGIRSYRETLRQRGVTTQRLLKKDETLRDVAHTGHRY
jgi:hypothetical protein